MASRDAETAWSSLADIAGRAAAVAPGNEGIEVARNAKRIRVRKGGHHRGKGEALSLGKRHSARGKRGVGHVSRTADAGGDPAFVQDGHRKGIIAFIPKGVRAADIEPS